MMNAIRCGSRLASSLGRQQQRSSGGRSVVSSAVRAIASSQGGAIVGRLGAAGLARTVPVVDVLDMYAPLGDEDL